MKTAYQINHSVYLKHYGIQGQKWGVRNGPPYPLGASQKSASEKKASVRKSLDKVGNKTHTESVSGRVDKDNQKRGLTVAAAALMTYGAYKLKESGKLDSLIENGKSKAEHLLSKTEFRTKNAGDVKDFGKLFNFDKSSTTSKTSNGIKKLAKPESLQDTLKNVNPHHGDSRYDNNCTLCSITSFLRQQGYDVKAGQTEGERQNLGGIVETCFKGAKVFDGSAVKFGRSRQDAAEMLLRRFGENAKGVCSIEWKNGNGHAFNWEIKEGVVSFFDGQSGWGDKIVSRFWSQGLINPNGSLQLARLDGLEINFEAVMELLE